MVNEMDNLQVNDVTFICFTLEWLLISRALKRKMREYCMKHY